MSKQVSHDFHEKLEPGQEGRAAQGMGASSDHAAQGMGASSDQTVPRMDASSDQAAQGMDASSVLAAGRTESIYVQSGVAMTCRSYDEYELMFMLKDELPPQGAAILDVAAGASSFTAELNKRGYQAVACDPRYEMTADAMYEHGLQEQEIASQKLTANAQHFVWKAYASPQAHNDIRQRSLEQFISHYRQHTHMQQESVGLSNPSLARTCYFAARLPHLPFEDHSFELVVCNHFLFLYQEQFDYRFHLQALLELLRVTRTGGRIVVYPLVGFRNELYPHLCKLQAVLRAADAEVTLRSTEFRFLPAADSFLQIVKR